jgi:hypothetical protein
VHLLVLLVILPRRVCLDVYGPALSTRGYTDVDFIAATDALTGRVTHDELAGELGVSVQTIRQARMDPSAPGHRSPPAGWEAAVARLARRRGGELLELAEALEDGG